MCVTEIKKTLETPEPFGLFVLVILSNMLKVSLNTVVIKNEFGPLPDGTFDNRQLRCCDSAYR